MKCGRPKGGVHCYDRAEVRRVLETHGLVVARARWPKWVVDPIARVLGLMPAYLNRRDDRRLTKAQLAQLGSKSDIQLAAEWGIPHSTVRHARAALGIEVSSNTRWQRRHAELIKKLQGLSDDELRRPLEFLVKTTGIRSGLLGAERVRRGLRRNPGRGRDSRLDRTNQLRLVAIAVIRDRDPRTTLDELAKVFNIGRERMRQIIDRARIEGTI